MYELFGRLFVSFNYREYDDTLHIRLLFYWKATILHGVSSWFLLSIKIFRADFMSSGDVFERWSDLVCSGSGWVLCLIFWFIELLDLRVGNIQYWRSNVLFIL